MSYARAGIDAVAKPLVARCYYATLATRQNRRNANTMGSARPVLCARTRFVAPRGEGYGGVARLDVHGATRASNAGAIGDPGSGVFGRRCIFKQRPAGKIP